MRRQRLGKIDEPLCAWGVLEKQMGDSFLSINWEEGRGKIIHFYP